MEENIVVGFGDSKRAQILKGFKEVQAGKNMADVLGKYLSPADLEKLKKSKDVKKDLFDLIDHAKKEDLSKAKKPEGDEHWITVNGRHILIGGSGEVVQGGGGMADGKDIKKIDSSKASPNDDFNYKLPKNYHEDNPKWGDEHLENIQGKLKNVINNIKDSDAKEEAESWMEDDMVNVDIDHEGMSIGEGVNHFLGDLNFVLEQAGHDSIGELKSKKNGGNGGNDGNGKKGKPMDKREATKHFESLPDEEKIDFFEAMFEANNNKEKKAKIEEMFKKEYDYGSI